MLRLLSRRVNWGLDPVLPVDLEKTEPKLLSQPNQIDAVDCIGASHGRVKSLLAPAAPVSTVHVLK